MDGPEPVRVPSRILAAGIAVALLGAAALLSGPLFGATHTGPSSGTPSFTAPAATPTLDPWAALRRPLALPLPIEGSCPATDLVPRSPDLAMLPGRGPVVPFGAFHAGRLFYDADAARWDSLSLFWVSDGQPVDALVRGRSLDGRRRIGFGDALGPLFEMQLNGNEAEELVPGWWLFHGDVARVQEPGCYGLQIDTATGSSVVVFDARPADEAVTEMLTRPVTPVTLAVDACATIRPEKGAPPGTIGRGPAYLVTQGGSISLSEAPTQDGWYQVGRLPWLIDPHERGPAVIRSATAAEIRFGGTSADRATLVLPVTSFIHGDEDPGWRNFISDAWVRAPGCYALQVDQLSASYRFVAFEVVS